MNSFGKNYKFTIFGQSHSEAIGAVIEGLPSGFEPDLTALSAFMQRRAPGGSKLTTPRKEADSVRFISGLFEGKTCGAPIMAAIFNENTRSSDYLPIKDTPRPGHADFTAISKFGDSRDYTGGGQFSGRLTAPLCIAGSLAIQALAQMGVSINARAVRIAGKTSQTEMEEAVLSAKHDGDSVGGVIECIAQGLPSGVGEPMFGSVESLISQAVFAIPAVKGIEFGNGFACADIRGSENNDEFKFDGDRVITETNNHGGILGGITSGMPIVFRVAVKPTPSIAKKQKTVDMKRREATEIEISGRHDPCIVPRAVVCVEAACAVVLYDLVLEANKWK